tara:strand:+ start:340 stop:558 length:219 start_codon:yes stop_codon:yes gene_type:complete
MQKNTIKRTDIEIQHIAVIPQDNMLLIDLSINGQPFEDLYLSIDDFKYQFSTACDGIHSIYTLNDFIKLLKK